MVERVTVNHHVAGSSPARGAGPLESLRMTYYTYVIVSLATGQLYVGQTNHLLARYRRHASGLVHSTKNLIPHVVAHVEQFPDRAAAMRREKQLKQHAGRQWIRASILPLVRRLYPNAQW